MIHHNATLRLMYPAQGPNISFHVVAPPDLCDIVCWTPAGVNLQLLSLAVLSALGVTVSQWLASSYVFSL